MTLMSADGGRMIDGGVVLSRERGEGSRCLCEQTLGVVSRAGRRPCEYPDERIKGVQRKAKY
jgi:hypothetical protein